MLSIGPLGLSTRRTVKRDRPKVSDCTVLIIHRHDRCEVKIKVISYILLLFPTDRVFNSSETTNDVYEEIALPILEKAMDGVNGKIINT